MNFNFVCTKIIATLTKRSALTYENLWPELQVAMDSLRDKLANNMPLPKIVAQFFDFKDNLEKNFCINMDFKNVILLLTKLIDTKELLDADDIVKRIETACKDDSKRVVVASQWLILPKELEKVQEYIFGRLNKAFINTIGAQKIMAKSIYRKPISIIEFAEKVIARDGLKERQIKDIKENILRERHVEKVQITDNKFSIAYDNKTKIEGNIVLPKEFDAKAACALFVYAPGFGGKEAVQSAEFFAGRKSKDRAIIITYKNAGKVANATISRWKQDMKVVIKEMVKKYPNTRKHVAVNALSLQYQSAIRLYN